MTKKKNSCVSIELRGLPHIFQLEITNFCNFSCPICPYGLGMDKRPAQFLPMVIIESWLKRGDFDNTPSIDGLHVMGEPTHHHQYFDIIDLFGRYNIPVKDATNGIMFKEKDFVKKLLEVDNLEFLVISLDATNYVEFSRVKGVTILYSNGIFPRITKGIKDYLSKVENTKVSVKMTKQPNVPEHSLVKFKEQWSDYVIPGQISVDIKFLDSLGGRLDIEVGRPTLSEAGGICPEPFHRVSVLSNGDVVPCYYYFDSEITYGSLYSHSIDKIWKSLSHKLLAESMLRGLYYGPCSNCREWMIPTDVEMIEL